MTGLKDLIAETIRAEGPISVARYMDLALQHPAYGYYRQKDRLGADGDFITAPEISQMFGELVGLWCAEAWREMGKPPLFTLLELGPGRGTMMQDALRATRRVDGFHAAMHLSLVESNEAFRAEQLKRLGVFSPVYLTDLSLLPPMPLIVVANEFFDAMPIQQMMSIEEVGTALWAEKKVGLAGDRLSFVADPPLPPGKPVVRETSPVSIEMMRKLASHVAIQGGAGLFIDYGYTTSSGSGTLQAVAGHRAVDPLQNPGEADLTAHVDFTALGEKAGAEGAVVWGPTTQGEFLQALGIDLRAKMLSRDADEAQKAALESGLHRLVDEDQMGALFKVMAISSPDVRDLPGFGD